MPRILTPRELESVANFIASKLEYWDIALGITDTMRRNPRYAERTRQKMEEDGHVFDITRIVGEHGGDPRSRLWIDYVLDPSPRFWK